MKQKFCTDAKLIEIKSRVECNIKQNTEENNIQEIDKEQLESEVEGENSNLFNVGFISTDK